MFQSKLIQYLTITPALIQLVILFIHFFETEGNGEEKRQAVLQAIGAVYEELGKFFPLQVSYDYVLGIANHTIQIVVAFYNLVGIFKKSDPGSSNTI